MADEPPTRGERLCAELTAGGDLGPAGQLLAEELGRIADRLDRLHEHLADRRWLQFQVAPYSTAETVTVVVKLDRVLAETRQQQDTLRSLVGELRQSGALGSKAPPAQQSPDASEVSGLGDLLGRIADRRGASAG